jgi:hypothetical protein
MKIFDSKVKNIDGIPIWEYLKNDTTNKETSLTNKDFGKFAEIIASRITWNFVKSGILKDVFPDISIISVNRRNMKVGDLGYIISYKDSDDQYRQKVVIFEIKHGRVMIGKYQFEKYCRILINPKDYFPKADEVKIVFMMFNEIDTKNKTANYALRELDLELARKYLENEKVLINMEILIVD